MGSAFPRALLHPRSTCPTTQRSPFYRSGRKSSATVPSSIYSHSEIVLQSASLNILLALASRKDALLPIIHQFPAYLTAVQATDANNRFYVHMGEFIPIVNFSSAFHLGAAPSLRRPLPRVQHPGELGVPRAGRVLSVSDGSDSQHAGRAVLLPSLSGDGLDVGQEDCVWEAVQDRYKALLGKTATEEEGLSELDRTLCEKLLVLSIRVEKDA